MLANLLDKDSLIPTRLENLVFQKLVDLGHIIQDKNKQINITNQGKTFPEYQ